MKIGIVLASREDLVALRPAIELLSRLGCPCEVFSSSIWAAPERLLAWAERAEHQGMRVILAAQGTEPQLPGFIAAASHLPVLAVPTGEAMTELAQNILPPAAAAAPVAHIAPGGAEQAALLAIRILATGDPALVATLDRFRQELVDRIESAQAEFETSLPQKPGQSAKTVGEPTATAPACPQAPPRPSTGRPAPARPEPKSETTSEGERGVEYAESEEGPIAIRPVSFDRPLTGQPLRNAPAPGEPAKPARAARHLGRVRIDTDAPQFDIIEDAVDCLLEGGVIAFPTETVYGLAADATNPAAVERIYELKNRPHNKAITLLVDSPKQLSTIACNLTVETRRLTEAFWPGPLTVVFQKRPGNFTHVSPTDTIGVRLPDHSIPLAIMQALARPLACTSANLAGQPEAMSADEVERAFDDRLNLLLDGGHLPQNVPSTVIDVTREPYRVLRLGGVSHAQLAAIVGDKLEPEG